MKAVTASALRRLVFLLSLLAAGSALAKPDIQHWTAETGARVYFVPVDALPMLDVRIDFDAGSARDPDGQAGLAALARGLLESGTAELDEQAIAEAIADTGARFGGGLDGDRAWFSVRTLSSAAERDAAIALAAQLIAQPEYPTDVLEREKSRSRAALREALTRPAVLAERRFEERLFAGHPYGQQISLESIDAIGRDALRDFHRRHYAANNASITIVGDASRAEAERIALTLTRELPTLQSALPAIPEPAPTRHQIERIANPSAQAHLLAGLPGMSRQDPDYYPLLVGNHILGGSGLVSRLSQEVREKRGFAYSVYSYFMPRAVPGPFQIGLQTRGAQVDDALELVRSVLADFIAQGPSEEELKAAKDNLINGFGLRLDANSKILDWVAMIGFYELPLDWLDAYTEHVAAVSLEDIREAFQRRVRPEQLIVVIAGGDGDEQKP